jgi:glutathione peroxidase-family protein
MRLLETTETEIKQDLDSFKNLWRRVTKQQKGDVVQWNGQEFMVEDIREVPDQFKDKVKPGEKMYTICRFDTVSGMKLKILCHKISAVPNEWRTHE